MKGLGDGALRTVLAWLAIAILAIPVGGALWLGVAHGESPCILCWAQRTSMVLIALVALFVVRWGPRPRYVGLLVILGAWGIHMGLRHWSLHIARDVGQGFAGTILGVHTYTWSYFIHWVVLLGGGALLLLIKGPLGGGKGDAGPGRTGRFAMALLVVLAAANGVQAFVSTGPPPFLGQGDPVRLSLNPRYWVWSLGELGGPISLRGSWTIPRPDASGVDPDPSRGPLAGLPELEPLRTERITAELDAPLAGLAMYAPPGGEAPGVEETRVLAVDDDSGVYVLDGSFSRILHRVVLDPYFSVHLTPLAGTALLGPDTLAVMSDNKSYILLTPDAAADPVREWRHFLETDGTVSELRRSRFQTVRAREQYALSLAYDAASDELITVGVPSRHHRRLVVSRFDRADFVLSSEFLPALGDGLALAGPERELGEYYVTAATVVDGSLYAVSAAFSTLLVIDLATETLTAAYALPGVSGPVGLTSRGGELLVARADGTIVVLARPGA